MKITIPGKDIIVIDDQNVFKEFRTDKVHLIRLKFDSPDEDQMDWVLNAFPHTNRFVIDTLSVRFYNHFFKNTNHKYYVINAHKNWSGIISFFKKNNKVLLDFTKLSEDTKKFLLRFALQDVLNNTEVVLLEKSDYTSNIEIFNNWRGNVVIKDDNYEI